MTEQEKRVAARRIAEGSNVFDFDKALELVQRRPADAERLLRLREENARHQEERARTLKRLKLAAKEFR